MPVTIFSNNIPLPDRREKIENAVLEGLGARPEDQDWTLSIYEPQLVHRYTITIEGPKDFRWEHTFEGPDEMTPDFIWATVQQATQRA